MLYSNKIYLKFITKDNNKHNKCNKIIAAFVYEFSTGHKYYVNFCHGDLLIDDTFENFKDELETNPYKVYVTNKKDYKYWLDCDLIDVNLFGFIENNEVFEKKSYTCKNFIQIGIGNINDYNLIVPLVIHKREFDDEVDRIKSLGSKHTDSYCFKFFNDVLTDTLFEVEKNGLKVDIETFNNHFDGKVYNGYVYTNYYIYNPTGRPSNRFDRINYAALHKEGGSRSSFVSRFGSDGYLWMVDFTGFHPYIVSYLVDYKVPDNETIYEHLAKYYYDTDVISPELLASAKKLTMFNLYGQINESYLNIPYFVKAEEFKNKYWVQFINNGYVETPVYKRKITNKHIVDPNKNKLFAYIIQAAETEFAINSLNSCLKFISDKQIIPILYMYDSILFDVHNSVNKDVLEDLIDIIKNKMFKVKVYKGNNYNDLKLL